MGLPLSSQVKNFGGVAFSFLPCGRVKFQVLVANFLILSQLPVRQDTRNRKTVG